MFSVGSAVEWREKDRKNTLCVCVYVFVEKLFTLYNNTACALKTSGYDAVAVRHFWLKGLLIHWPALILKVHEENI